MDSLGNQFGSWEPRTNEEIKNLSCTIYKDEFPVFDKVDINGTNTTSIYNFL